MYTLAPGILGAMVSIMLGYNFYKYMLFLIPCPTPCAARFQGYGTYLASF